MGNLNKLMQRAAEEEMSTAQRFSASMDSMSKGLTTTYLLVYVVMVMLSYRNHQGFTILTGSIIIFLGLIFLVTFLFSPRYYVVTKQHVLVKCPLMNITYPKQDIVTARMLTSQESNRTIRTFAIGGLFGYIGKFRNSTLGSMLWLATQRRNFVLLEIEGGKKRVVLTPDEPEQFLKAVTTP